MIFDLACRTAELLGCPGVVVRGDVRADTSYVGPGPGHGLPRADTIEAICMFAELEGLLLDPVYSGKGGAAPAEAPPSRDPPDISSLRAVRSAATRKAARGYRGVQGRHRSGRAALLRRCAPRA
jgi:hypothetical protein